jgi:hypothetical protein
MDPGKCILESFTISNERIDLRFQNGSEAYISTKSGAGFLEIELLGKRLSEFLGKSYKDILETDF